MSGLTDKQIAERRQGITATDVPAILGLHPYRSAIDVWLEKMGEAPPIEENDRMRWGLLLEGPIREDYAKRHRARLYVPGTLTHRTITHHMATPDALIMSWGESMVVPTDPPGSKWKTIPFMYRAAAMDAHMQGLAEHGLEIKTHPGQWNPWRVQYGEPDTDEVPEHELLQCAWGMHVCELPRWDLVAFLDGLPEDYTIARNLELEDMLVDAVDRFWVDHVQARTPPAPDGSRQYTDWLRRRWPGRGPVVQADEPTAAAIERLRNVRLLERKVAAERKVLEQTIQSAMGDAEAIEGAGERILWTRCKDSELVDWKAVASAFRNELDVITDALAAGRPSDEVYAMAQAISPENVVKTNTKSTPGPRQFRVPRAWHKETE